MCKPVPKPETYAFDPKFLAWLRLQPCAACGDRYPRGFDKIEAAHLDSCRYGDARNAIPLCGSRHHREGMYSLHQMGREKFSSYWGIELRVLAEQLYEKYLRENPVKST